LPVSRRVRYQRSCANCEAQQEALVWRILYADERGSLADEPEAGLASVSCGRCGALAEIDEPLLVIRPDSALPLLPGLAMSELAARSGCRPGTGHGWPRLATAGHGV
jgi:hypothetical protein